MRAAKVQASLRIRAVSPKPSLLAHTISESRGTFRQKARSLAPLNGWACAVKMCHDRMLKDTNSLDGAHIIIVNFTFKVIFKVRVSSGTTYYQLQIYEKKLSTGSWQNYRTKWQACPVKTAHLSSLFNIFADCMSFCKLCSVLAHLTLLNILKLRLYRKTTNLGQVMRKPVFGGLPPAKTQTCSATDKFCI